MATQLFLRNVAERPVGVNVTTPETFGGTAGLLSTSRGAAAVGGSRSSGGAGPTNGIILGVTAGIPWLGFITDPLGAAVTISGSITVNLRMNEGAMTDNIGAQVVIFRCDSAGNILSTVANSEKGSEMGTSEAAQNWSVTPTSTSFAKGDRILVVPCYNDAGGTMGSLAAGTLWWDGPTAGASGDSYVTFTETLDFTLPTFNTKFYFKAAAADADLSADTDKALSTTIGAAKATYTTSTVAGPTAGVQVAPSGTAISWWTLPVSAVSIAGGSLIAIKFWANENTTSTNASLRFKIEQTDGSGTVLSTIADGTFADELPVNHTTTGWTGYLQAAATSLSSGDRIKVTVYGDDAASASMVSGSTFSFYVDDAASNFGDSSVSFEETISVQSAPTISLGLLDAGPALYAPTLSLAPYPISLGLLDAGPALYAPTLAATNTLTLGLLDAGPALYAPTIVPGPVGVTLPLLDGAPALYAPTLSPKNLIALGLLDAAPALYAPTVQPKNLIALGLLDAGPALYAPTLANASAPQDVTLPLLDAGPALYAPTVQPTNTLTFPLLDAAAALYAPTLVPGPVGVTLPLLDAGPALYAPTLSLAPYPVTLPLLDGAPTLYAPTLAVGPVGITLPLLDGAPTLYAPTVSQGAATQSIDLGLLDGAPALYAPTVTPTWALSIPLLDAAAALYAPSLAVGPVAVSLPLLDAGAALYAPTVIPGPVLVSLPLLDGAPALYPPVLGPVNLVALDLLDAGPALYAPTLAGVGGSTTLVLDFLDAGAALYAPTLAQTHGILTGRTRDQNGHLLVGATVRAFRTSDNVHVATATSDGNGVYQLVLLIADAPYYLVAYRAGSPDIAGTTLNTLVPS